MLPDGPAARGDPDRARGRRGDQRPAGVAPAVRRGRRAFAHKAGLHASAIKVDPNLYQHMDPSAVGNDMRLLVSDMAGRASASS